MDLPSPAWILTRLNLVYETQLLWSRRGQLLDLTQQLLQGLHYNGVVITEGGVSEDELVFIGSLIDPIPLRFPEVQKEHQGL